LGAGAAQHLLRHSGRDDLSAQPIDHAMAARDAQKTLVLGFCSKAIGADVPNEFIAQYVASHNDRMIGIAGLDPMADGALFDAGELLDRPEFHGLSLSPSAQCFHPADTRAMEVYELAQDRGRPIFFHQGMHFFPQGRMEFARPYLLDEIARAFPGLTIVITHVGLPWVSETISLLGKHPNVYADIAGLAHSSWQMYTSLLLAYQYNVMDKLLFASGFPFCTAALAIQKLYRLHELTQGTSMPTVPREMLRTVVEVNAAKALGLDAPAQDDGQ
jgi:predicted TIM-barrel fold metal-dependent hydrolase